MGAFLRRGLDRRPSGARPSYVTLSPSPFPRGRGSPQKRRGVQMGAFLRRGRRRALLRRPLSPPLTLPYPQAPSLGEGVRRGSGERRPYRAPAGALCAFRSTDWTGSVILPMFLLFPVLVLDRKEHYLYETGRNPGKNRPGRRIFAGGAAPINTPCGSRASMSSGQALGHALRRAPAGASGPPANPGKNRPGRRALTRSPPEPAVC